MLNDGAHGAEIHKLRADKLDDSGSMFGRRLAGIAKGFGLHGATITSIDQIGGLLEEFKASKEPTLWDFHTSDGCGANLRYADMRIGCAVYLQASNIACQIVGAAPP